MTKTPKEKALELVGTFYKTWKNTDIYWEPTDLAKQNAEDAVKLVSDNSEYWQEVIKEIYLLPESVEDLFPEED